MSDDVEVYIASVKSNTSDSCKIPLYNKKKHVIGHATVDIQDYNRLSKYRWFIYSTNKTVTRSYMGIKDGERKQIYVYMHKEVLDVADDLTVHRVFHKNGNKLDNRRENLHIGGRKTQKEMNEEWYKKNKHKVSEKWFSMSNEEKRDRSRKFNYGMTREEFDLLYMQQEEKCAICKRHIYDEGHKLVVDHCHTTGDIRGLLCNRCNNRLDWADKYKIEIEEYLAKSREITNV